MHHRRSYLLLEIGDDQFLVIFRGTHKLHSMNDRIEL
jgi:hypothetical protein